MAVHNVAAVNRRRRSAQLRAELCFSGIEYCRALPRRDNLLFVCLRVSTQLIRSPRDVCASSERRSTDDNEGGHNECNFQCLLNTTVLGVRLFPHWRSGVNAALATLRTMYLTNIQTFKQTKYQTFIFIICMVLFLHRSLIKRNFNLIRRFE